MMSTNNTPTPADSRQPESDRHSGTDAADNAIQTADLGVLESLAALPVAQHLDIYEELHGQLSADLGSTSQEQW